MRAIKRRCWISNQSSSFSPDGEKTKHQKSLPPLSLSLSLSHWHSLLIPASAQTDRDSFLPTRDSLGRPTERGKWEGAINTLKKLSKWAAPKNLALPKPGKRGGRVNWGGEDEVGGEGGGRELFKGTGLFSLISLLSSYSFCQSSFFFFFSSSVTRRQESFFNIWPLQPWKLGQFLSLKLSK